MSGGGAGDPAARRQRAKDAPREHVRRYRFGAVDGRAGSRADRADGHRPRRQAAGRGGVGSRRGRPGRGLGQDLRAGGLSGLPAGPGLVLSRREPLHPLPDVPARRRPAADLALPARRRRAADPGGSSRRALRRLDRAGARQARGAGALRLHRHPARRGRSAAICSAGRWCGAPPTTGRSLSASSSGSWCWRPSPPSRRSPSETSSTSSPPGSSSPSIRPTMRRGWGSTALRARSSTRFSSGCSAPWASPTPSTSSGRSRCGGSSGRRWSFSPPSRRSPPRRCSPS